MAKSTNNKPPSKKSLRSILWPDNLSRTAGQLAEDQALLYLQKQGLKLVVRNFSCRSGELDLIMRDKDTLVFIEVRYRKQAQYGSSAETVTCKKQRKLIKAAQYFLGTQQLTDWPACRFDVMAARPDKKQPTSLYFDWIKSAFDLQ